MGPDTDEPQRGDSGTESAAADDPRADIMRATYRALCAHGYADLTMQDIADEAPVSKAALHYHYDSKRDLLAAFQAFIADRFLCRIRDADDPAADPRDRLAAVLDAALSPPSSDDELRDIQRALLELKAQAPYKSRLRDHVERTDRAFRDIVADILADGVETGAFDATLDPEATAAFVATVMAGNQAQQVAVGQSPAETRELLRIHVEERVVAESDGEQAADDTDADEEAGE
jgi:AcrR family transcriptional regulator